MCISFSCSLENSCEHLAKGYEIPRQSVGIVKPSCASDLIVY